MADIGETLDTGSSATGDPLLVFMPSGRRGYFPKGTPILSAARQLGVDIDSVCGGRGICGRCQVVVSEGEFAKLGVTSDAHHLSDFSSTEQRYSDKRGMKPGRRLSCSAQLLGDLVIDVPADSQVHKQVVRKRAEMREITLDPVIRLHYVEVREPDMHDPTGDLQRLEEALKAQWNLEGLDCDVRAIQGLQQALRKGEWKVTVAVHLGKQITAVWPGFQDKIYGFAVDVGSTTIAGHLCDLATGDVVASSGLMNPQIRFGEDLMSRVSYVMMNPGGDADMTKAVREALNDLAQSVAKEAGCTVNDILECTFVGNPIMHHLLLGINPIELGWAPFALATDGPVQIWEVGGQELKHLNSWQVTGDDVHNGKIEWLGWLDDGRLMTIDRRGLTVWNVDGPSGEYQIMGDGMKAPSFSPGGKQFAVGTDKGMSIHDAASGELLTRIKMDHGFNRQVAFSPSGKLLAATGQSGVDVYDATTGEKVMDAYAGNSRWDLWICWVDEEHVLVGVQ